MTSSNYVELSKLFRIHYVVKRREQDMSYSQRTQKKIVVYSAIFKQLGIITEQEYKEIKQAYIIKNAD